MTESFLVRTEQRHLLRRRTSAPLVLSCPRWCCRVDRLLMQEEVNVSALKVLKRVHEVPQ